MNYTIKERYSQDIVNMAGPENISKNPVTLDSYVRCSSIAAGMDKFVSRYKAMTLPKNTGGNPGKELLILEREAVKFLMHVH